MQDDYYENMYDLETSHWWFVGKRHLIDVLIRKFIKTTDMQILDVGCGTGIMLTHLKKYGNAIGVDDSEIALSFCRERGHTNIVKVPAIRLPFEKEMFDLITCLDVLTDESIKDDLQVLRESYRVLKKGGWMITSDPAYRFLWSGHDVSEGTRERYTKKILIEKMKGAGFNIKKGSYWNTFLFVVVFAVRATKNLFLGKREPNSDLYPVPSPLNQILTLVLKLEAHLLRKINLPFGVSVLCIGKKE